MIQVFTTVFREFVKLAGGCFFGVAVSGCQQKINGALFFGSSLVFSWCAHILIVALCWKITKHLQNEFKILSNTFAHIKKRLEHYTRAS
jgi:hypothetical protein